MEKIAMQIRLSEIREIAYENNVEWGVELQDLVWVKISLRTFPDFENRSIELHVGAIYHNDTADLLKYEVKSVFEIGDMDMLVRMKDDKAAIAPELLCILVGVTIGSLRGMLAMRTQGTVFERHPLPIINVTELIASLQSGSSSDMAHHPVFRFRYE